MTTKQSNVALGIQVAREMIREGLYQQAEQALDLVFRELGVPAGEINPRLQRVNATPRVQNSLHSGGSVS